MVSSLYVLLSIIQDEKAVKGSEIFEIKGEQNHTFRSLFNVLLQLQGINTAARNTLFLLFCMKTKLLP